MNGLSIDYGSFPMKNGQLPNRHPDTGVRYGIANSRDLADWVFDHLEYHYAFGCPECGAELNGDDPERYRLEKLRSADDAVASPAEFEPKLTCPTCRCKFHDWEGWGEDPVEVTIDLDGVKGRLDEMGDFWVFESPVITAGVHCSPCAPGAVTIYPHRVESGGAVSAYGLPDDWWR